MQTLNLSLTDSARAAIDAFMAGLDYEESIPCLTHHRLVANTGHHAGRQWTVGAFHPERVRFFEQLCRSTGTEFFFKCDGVVLLLWQPALAPLLCGRTLDYTVGRYLLR